MKRFFRMCAFVVLMTTALVACDKSNFEENNPNYNVEFTSVDIVASLPEGSRVELGDDTGAETPIYWSEDDQIVITIADEEYTFVIKNYTPNQTKAIFHCDQAPATLEAGDYVAIYKATTTQEQSGLKSDVENYQPMSAEFTINDGEDWNDVKLSFSSDVAIVKFNLFHDNFYGKEISEVKFKDGSDVVASATSIFTGDANGKVEVYFAIEPQEFIAPSIEVVCDGKTYKALMSPNTLNAGKLYRIRKQMAILVMSGTCNASGSAAFDLYYYTNCESLTLAIYPTINDDEVFTDDYRLTNDNNYTNAPWAKDGVELEGYEYNTTNIISNIDIREGINGIGDNAFSELRNVWSINIPSSLSVIGEQDYFGVSNAYITDLEQWCNITFESAGSMPVSDLNLNGEVITNLVIPESVTEIKDYAFAGCNLESVTLHENIQFIGIDAFVSYMDQFDVYCKAINPPVGSQGMFYNASLYSVGTIIHVPSASLELYKSADYWKDYEKDIVGDIE